MHETCKCTCRLNKVICNNKQKCNKDQCRCECKELINKGVCDKGYLIQLIVSVSVINHVILVNT